MFPSVIWEDRNWSFSALPSLGVWEWLLALVQSLGYIKTNVSAIFLAFFSSLSPSGHKISTICYLD